MTAYRDGLLNEGEQELLRHVEQADINSSWALLQQEDPEFMACVNAAANRITGGDIDKKSAFIAGATSIASLMMAKAFHEAIEHLAA